MRLGIIVDAAIVPAFDGATTTAVGVFTVPVCAFIGGVTARDIVMSVDIGGGKSELKEALTEPPFPLTTTTRFLGAPE